MKYISLYCLPSLWHLKKEIILIYSPLQFKMYLYVKQIFRASLEGRLLIKISLEEKAKYFTEVRKVIKIF